MFNDLLKIWFVFSLMWVLAIGIFMVSSIDFLTDPMRNLSESEVAGLFTLGAMAAWFLASILKVILFQRIAYVGFLQAVAIVLLSGVFTLGVTAGTGYFF